jgi:outer membrane protein OmpA-like peptidoglycan-associated protein
MVSPRYRFAILAATLTALPAQAQSLNDVLRGLQRGVEQAINRETQRRADDATTTIIQCAVGDRACEQRREREEARRKAEEQRKGNTGAPAIGAATTAPGSASAPRPGEGAWANYDYIPGERVLFLDDFTADRVGNFPRRLKFLKGNMEIVEWQGRRVLRVNSMGILDIALPQTLPARFTLEFDTYLPDSSDFQVYLGTPDGKRVGPQQIDVDPYNGVGVATDENAVRRGNVPNIRSVQPSLEAMRKDFHPVRVMADGSYVKVYVGERRVANLPNAELGRSTAIRFHFTDVRKEPVLLGPVRVALSEQQLVDKLIADGRVATQGILFDTGSADLRPESTPTLADIADALRARADLRLRIEGHTDNMGNAAANLALSEQRAKAVVAHLVERAGVAASRLEAAGLGDTKPSVSNDTPEGRQQNRRVELVVLK